MSDTQLREALTNLVAIIDKAGLIPLSNGVQLGQRSWYVKASDCMNAATAALEASAAQRMPLVYVAGPYRGANAWEIEENIRRAERLALDVWRTDKAAAMCPHTCNRFFQGAITDAVALAGTLAMLAQCDAMILLPDWRRSSGARAEHDFATAHRIPIFEDMRELRRWLGVPVGE